MQYHVFINGFQTEVAETRLTELHATEQLTDEDLVWDENCERWITIKSFFDQAPLIPTLQPPAPSAAPTKPARKNDGTKTINNSSPELSDSEAAIQRVTVVDVDMKFGTMVMFMVKWAFAAIPAVLIIFIILVAILVIFYAIATVVMGKNMGLPFF